MKSALLHVSVSFMLCVALANTRLFDRVDVDLSYEHYAEPRVEHFPAFLRMPFNSLVNLAYIYMGLYWILSYRGSRESAQSRYLREVFALMALFYAPVQWTRLAWLQRTAAVLDQWFTLPIFMWVPVWIHFIERGPVKWRTSQAASLELCSILSYGLALAHHRGFELALGAHVALALYKGIRVQLRHGDVRSQAFLVLAVLSCAGFVVLKLLDHWLAKYRLFQRLTGHFWSKVCDVLQFHFSFCFLTSLTQRAHAGCSSLAGD
ncbi:transmembrane protein 187 [Aulostomus maculatus]